MKTFAVSVIGVLIIIFLAVSCGPGPYSINNGQFRDPIFSFEPRQNGYFTIWAVHDDVGSYCISDPALAEIARNSMSYPEPYNEVVVHYRSINNNDTEWEGLFEYGTGCAKDRATTVYLVTGIDLVNGTPPE